MQIKVIKRYLFLGAFLFALIALPPFFIEPLRTRVILAFSPLWKGLYRLKAPFLSKKDQLEILYKKLEAENLLLRSELKRYQDFYRQSNIQESLKSDNRIIFSRVIFRDPGSWHSSFWVNAGEETNKLLKKKVVTKNSPVLFGKGVVGVIDFVGKKQSRVRLITDSGLKISVRAARGSFQKAFLVEHVDVLLRALASKQGIPFAREESVFMKKKLEQWKTSLKGPCEGWFLAKGIIQGSGSPLWRKKRSLKGTGFNYDYADEEGPARDLYTGAPLNSESNMKAMPLIKENDLLITTGMDGVFPKGFPVGEVVKVYDLKEGAYTYEIEAVPIVANLDEINMVFIIPPISENLSGF